jgi:Raf kinase inhibitor-like YbhB/YbcL family protein
MLTLACSLGCRAETGSREAKADRQHLERGETTMQLQSSSFEDGQRIPVKHTADGVDVSPALQWSGVPEGTKALVLICDDPDAPVGNWVHWVLYDIPPGTAELPEGVPTDDTVLGSARQGRNDFRKLGYGGPAPPPGKVHRYIFTLYAVDKPTGLGAGARKPQVLAAIEGHVLATAKLMGTYSR